MKLTHLLLTAALACGVAVDPAAASTYTIGGDVHQTSGRTSSTTISIFSFDDFYLTSSTSSVADGASGGVGNAVYAQTGQIDARAGFGSVGISGSTDHISNVQRNLFGDDYETVVASGNATAIFTDVLVSGPGSGNVSTRLRLHVGGYLSVNSSSTAETDGSVATAYISMGIDVNGTTVRFGNRSLTSTEGVPNPPDEFGLFVGLGNGGVVTTDLFSVPLNTPITIKLMMYTAVQSTLQRTAIGAASANSNFYNSLSFATDQPVFDLPAGYTANSIDGGIVANGYTPVPEPGTAALLLLAAPTTLLRRRRRA